MVKKIFTAERVAMKKHNESNQDSNKRRKF